MKKIGLIIGSVRKGSYSQAVAHHMKKQLEDNYEVIDIKIDDLPLYNQDTDMYDTPVEYTRLRDVLKTCDGVLFVTPEYNRAVPPIIKNALDAGSRPFGDSAWNGLPGLVISVSMGALGGYAANQNLREIASVLNIKLMAHPEVYLSGVHKYIDDDGVITAPDTVDFLNSVAIDFSKWVEQLNS